MSTSFLRRAALVVFIAGLGLTGCGSDSKTSTTTAAKTTKTTTAGGGGMSAGAPQFLTFEVSGSVPCKDGNATATMKYTTANVVGIEIKIGASGKFAGTAGYGPNETAAVASIPCTGAGTSQIQLRGCTEDNECAESEARTVTITG